MKRTTKCPPRTLKDMFHNTFRISKIFGLFPFVFTDNDLVISLHLFLFGVIYMTFISCTIIHIIVLHIMDAKSKSYVLLFSFIFPCLLSIIVPIVSIFWLWINSKNLRKIFRALKVVGGVAQVHGSFSNKIQHLAMFFIVIGTFIIDTVFSLNPLMYNCCYYLTMINLYLVIIQFTSILTIIRNFYSSLEDTLCNTNAMEWAQCHEVLGACCEIVNRCYTPQLFIYTISTFSFITSTIYVLIAQMSLFYKSDMFISMVWVFFISLSLWAFIYNCHDTVQRVSYLIIGVKLSLYMYMGGQNGVLWRKLRHKNSKRGTFFRSFK